MKIQGVFFVFLVTCILLPAVVSAQGLNVEVSPGKVNRIVERGGTFTQTFRIGNYSGADKTFYLSVQDFSVNSETGAPSFAPAEQDKRYSLAQWMELPAETITVPAGEVRTVDVTIRVPQDAEVGGHYGAFFVQTDDPSFIKKEQGSVIGSIGRIAALLLVTVPGDITEKVTLASLETDKRIYWEAQPQVTFHVRLKNEGTVHAIPTGAIFIGGGIAYKGQSVIFNKEQGAVLPGAPARRISETVTLRKTSLLPPMGRFDAQFLARYGLSKQKVDGATTFYVIPVKFLAALFAGVLVVLFIAYRAGLSFLRRA